ncbi:MAG: hypothetical protein IJ306_10175 [Oscillospiraceae bacterium]|nr:hypothetical protein [Oscillospiraceae bacterium]
MAGINISSGTEEEKKNAGTGGNVKENLPGLPGNTNTDGGGATSGTGGNAGAGISSGGTGAKPETVYVGGANDNYVAPVGSAVNNPGTTAAGTTAKEPTAQEQAETSLAQLRNEYAAQLREQYNQSAERLKTERDEALRENWVLEQQARAALPEQMAAQGINGGATETSLAALRAQFQGNRNDIRSGYAENIGDLNIETAQQQAEAQRDYNDRWIAYLLSLAEKEKDYEYAKKLG